MNGAKNQRALRLIALFEAVKGITVLAASIGLLSLLHHDIRHIARQLLAHLDVNPSARYPAALLHYADILHDANIRTFLLFASGYSTIRLFESYGLWNDLAWAEWLGALSGAIYIPFEVQHLIHRHSIASALVFAVNILVVTFLAYRLWRRSRFQSA